MSRILWAHSQQEHSSGNAFDELNIREMHWPLFREKNTPRFANFVEKVNDKKFNVCTVAQGLAQISTGLSALVLPIERHVLIREVGLPSWEYRFLGCPPDSLDMMGHSQAVLPCEKFFSKKFSLHIFLSVSVTLSFFLCTRSLIYQAYYRLHHKGA